MSMGIGTSSGSRWTSYAAWTQMRNTQRQPPAQASDAAGPPAIRADSGVTAEHQRVRQLRPGHALDVTV